MLKNAAMLFLAVLSACGPSGADVASLWRRVTDDEPPTKLTLGSLPNRFFVIGQKSYWTPQGVDSAVVPVVDTLMILGPDSAGGDSVGFSTDQGCCSGKLMLEHDTAAKTLRVRVVDNWHDPESEAGGLLLEAGAWRQTIAQHDTGAWHDSSTVRHRSGVSDSSVQVSARQGRALGWVSYAGARWLRMSATRAVELTGRRTIERELSRAGTSVEFRFSGSIGEEFLYEPRSGFVDSLQARGTLEGQFAYQEATGQVDTVHGSWRVERRGGWRYYAELQPEEVIFTDTAGGRLVREQQRHLELTDQAFHGDSALVERVFHLRSDAHSPATRWPLDRIVRSLSYNRGLSSFVSDQALQQYRPGDRVLLETLLENHSRGSATIPLQPRLTKAVADQLAGLRVERRSQVNREALFSALNTALHEPGGVAASAGERVARLAQATDDQHARDLLLLAAYQSDPSRYLPLLDRLADSRPGTYGHVARVYAAGNLVAEFYGPNPSAFQRKWTGRPFPGLDRPWREHVAYFDHLPGGAALRRAQTETDDPSWLAGDGSYGPDYSAMARAVELLLRAQGVEPSAVFRHRFEAEPDSNGRFVWAHYLLAMQDTTPLPWVRGVYRSAGGKLAANAFRLLELHASLVADSLREPATLAALQDAVLGCVTGGVSLADTAGGVERGCGGRQADIPKTLQSDGLAPTTIEKWRGKFALRSHADFVRSGRQRRRWEIRTEMAIILSPVRRIENRYFIDYAFSPGSGEPCLCGNGGSFVLEQRNGRWVVVRSGWWIS